MSMQDQTGISSAKKRDTKVVEKYQPKPKYSFQLNPAAPLDDIIEPSVTPQLMMKKSAHKQEQAE